MPWNDCAAILLRAAELFGQGKNAWQAEIDAAAALGLLPFGVKYVESSTHSSLLKTHRIMEISPSNFAAIAGNLPGETCTGFHIFQLLGLRDSCGGWRLIQFIPGLPPEVVAPAISHPSFTALHFTGSTFVFQKLWKDIAAYLDKYRGYLRMRQEGKDFHVIHKSTEIRNTVFAVHSGQLRGPRLTSVCAGQKCYALSRLYVSSSVWSPGFKDLLLSEVAKIKVGSPSDFSNFMGLMIGRPADDKIMGFVQKAKDAGGEVLTGGHRDPESITMKEDIFGPIITVMTVLRKCGQMSLAPFQVYVYDDA
ncbi:Aldehyde/histidinol dehydrogenase [Suillus lakei]|nr:Aldehyde/histidinol dehydrogenase [Suillus lakei]